MQKIPTVFKRDPDNMRHLLPEVNPGCEWVLAGEGVATRKYDGTCMMFDGSEWWSRREVKPNKPVPENFVEIAYDENTEKRQGWVPFVPQGSKHPAIEAIANLGAEYEPGTYELIGPKINGNPEGCSTHILINHQYAEVYSLTARPRTFENFREIVVSLSEQGWEGLVWHHADGRMAKLKARDFLK